MRHVPSHASGLTLVKMGGPEVSALYREDTGLCIWSTEAFQSEGPAAAETFTSPFLPVLRLLFLPSVRAGTEPGPGWSNEEGLRGFWARTSGWSGTWKWSSSEL